MHLYPIILQHFNPLCTELFLGSLWICLHFLLFCSHWDVLKFFHKEDKDAFIIYSQCRGCWWPGDIRSISNHGIDLVHLEHSSFSCTRVQYVATGRIPYHTKPWRWTLPWDTYRFVSNLLVHDHYIVLHSVWNCNVTCVKNIIVFLVWRSINSLRPVRHVYHFSKTVYSVVQCG